VNGAHDALTLQTLMNGFVSRFVLCPKCSLPETTLVGVLRSLGVLRCRQPTVERSCSVLERHLRGGDADLRADGAADREAALAKDLPQVRCVRREGTHCAAGNGVASDACACVRG
jgi:hypothetical protein